MLLPRAFGFLTVLVRFFYRQEFQTEAGTLYFGCFASTITGNAGAFGGRAMSQRSGAISSRRMTGQSGMRMRKNEIFPRVTGSIATGFPIAKPQMLSR